MADLVTVYNTQDATDAYLVKSYLEANGVNVFLFDEGVSGNLGLSLLFGGIKLNVLASEASEAKEMLEKYQEAEPDE